jgi:predicted  nucleic acid-binding Zn-ribbon protein
MKEVVIKKNKETGKLRKEYYLYETDINILKDEVNRTSQSINETEKEKKNLKSAIVMLQKQNYKMKERVRKEDIKGNEFATDITNLISQHTQSC